MATPIPIVPPRVRPGDTVAVPAPSSTAPACWPHRVQRGAASLAFLGLQLRLLPNATAQTGWTAGPPQARADHLHAAVADDAVTVVLAAIGGNHANQLLPHPDWELIRAHPKVFQGFSDTTVLHWAFAKHAGLRTFYGPALVTGLAEYPEVLPDTDASLRAAWFSGQPLQFRPAEAWTDEFLDGAVKADLERPRRLRPSTGGGRCAAGGPRGRCSAAAWRRSAGT
jgi:muramoyltetrapeptide carboxypeptidase